MSGPNAAWASGLLVSVRSAEEAVVALAAGAAIIDVKEPSRGPLGRADADVTAAIVTAVDGRAAVTLACGELADGAAEIPRHFQDVCLRLGPRVRRPVAVKAGPAGLRPEAWPAAFSSLARTMPVGVGVVAVAYADSAAAASPDPEEIMAFAKPAASAVLVDTFDKAGPGLFGLVDEAVIRRWTALSRAAGLPLALAGRLSGLEVALAFRLGSNVVGVRSAACDAGRLGRIDGRRVAELVASGPAGTAPRPPDREYNPAAALPADLSETRGTTR